MPKETYVYICRKCVRGSPCYFIVQDNSVPNMCPIDIDNNTFVKWEKQEDEQERKE